MLARLFAALAKTSYEHAEIIVIDNGSTDETAEVIAGFSRWPIRHLKNHQNTTFLACMQSGGYRGDRRLCLVSQQRTSNRSTKAGSAPWSTRWNLTVWRWPPVPC